MTVHDAPAVRRALLSVSNKTGLADFAKGLQALGIEILSTGGTAKALAEAGVEHTPVDQVTRFPEILDGRVKTLHPAIHGGILARRSDQRHKDQLDKHKILGIDLVVVNLYPFSQTRASGASWPQCIENIDIGGPAMIRAAAKNYHDVTVVTNPESYAEVLEALTAGKGCIAGDLRRRLAAEAFQHTAAYDAAIAAAFAEEQKELFPKTLILTAERQQLLRYGENPHQQGAFYACAQTPNALAQAKQIQGKPLSYNNINDLNAAYAQVQEFPEPAVCIVKHANPCGVAVGKTLEQAYRKALATDPVSAFGGIIAVNKELDATAASAMTSLFLEVIVAPSFSHEALVVLSAKKNLRLLEVGASQAMNTMAIKEVQGGFLYQQRDANLMPTTDADVKVVTKRSPTDKEWQDLRFAFAVAKHVKSNAIVYAKDLATVGIGAGQMSRVDASRIAVIKAQDRDADAGLETSSLQGSVVASDAFFPFADGLLIAINAGASAVIQPGGSVRDEEVIKAADAHDVAMVFTGMRHFLH